MAAKSVRGSVNDPFTSEDKPYFFDVGAADTKATCGSCHPGGGPGEGIINEDNTLTPYDTPGLTPAHNYDRDFYSYDSNDLVKALYGGETIDETIADIGEPRLHDWNKSGVMEADCLLCHINPDSAYTYRAADGLKVQPFRPRLMIFANRDAEGKVDEISMGMPIKTGLDNKTAMYYTDGAQRMNRPTPMMTLAKLPKEMVGEMMQMWVTGLEQLEASGIKLPYALYADPTTVPKIWDMSTGMLKAEYCANPNGVMDEMQRLGGAQEALGQFFSGFLQYFIGKGMLPAEATMADLYKIMFNDFVYAYQIKYTAPGSDMLLPVPFGLRAYEPGKIYSDWDSCDASVRDFVRAGVIEGEGLPYSGRVGAEFNAGMIAMGMAMQGDTTYIDPATGQIDLASVLTDMQEGKLNVEPLLHDVLPSFFDMMPTADLMGLDFNGDNMPVTYVRIVRENDEWHAKAYYNVSDLDANGALPLNEMFGGSDDIDSPKWVEVCGQCHVMTKDHGNSEWTRGRTYMLGMPADWVKNGNYVNITDDKNAIGYDVHMSSKKLSCGSCHLRNSGDSEDKHNFLKGVDTAHMVRNDLDANLRPKSCEGCHLGNESNSAPNPTAKHEEVFGENTGRHIATISCQACHQPYSKTWRFRTFDDSLGYYTNFDNLMGYNVLSDQETGKMGDGKGMIFPDPAYALQPVYGTSPGYGIPHFNMVSQTIEADGNGVQSMDFVSQMVNYFNMDGDADPGKLVNGMPTNFKFDFWKYFTEVNFEMYKGMGVPLKYDPEQPNKNYPPLYYGNGINGYPQIVVGNPVTILTWADANPQPDADMSDLPYGGAKILYIRELNAIIKEYKRPVQIGMMDPKTMAMIGPNDATYANNPYVGRVVLKDSGYVLYDHTGDMFPDIWWDEDVKAVQAALTTVLKAEGEEDPHPVLFMAAHYFSDSHGIKPAEEALGSASCNDCHGDSATSAGAHRITDRNIVYMPWSPPWFRDENRLMRYNNETGKMDLTNPNGLFVLDGEVDYIKPMEANGLHFLGARADEVLAVSHHHAEELFQLASIGTVTGNEIPGIKDGSLTKDELAAGYARQVINGPWSDQHYVYVPEEIRPELEACGFAPSKEDVYLKGQGLVSAYILNYEYRESGEPEAASIICLPFTGATAEVWSRTEGSDYFTKDESAEVVGYQGGYILVKVEHPGEFVAVAPGTAGSSPLLNSLWGAFKK